MYQIFFPPIFFPNSILYQLISLPFHVSGSCFSACPPYNLHPFFSPFLVTSLFLFLTLNYFPSFPLYFLGLFYSSKFFISVGFFDPFSFFCFPSSQFSFFPSVLSWFLFIPLNFPPYNPLFFRLIFFSFLIFHPSLDSFPSYFCLSQVSRSILSRQ